MYDGVKSSWNTVLCRIPQGSILGPLLFLLYINDLANIYKHLKFIIFSDDTNVFVFKWKYEWCYNNVKWWVKEYECIYVSKLINYHWMFQKQIMWFLQINDKIHIMQIKLRLITFLLKKLPLLNF